MQFSECVAGSAILLADVDTVVGQWVTLMKLRFSLSTCLKQKGDMPVYTSCYRSMCIIHHYITVLLLFFVIQGSYLYSN